MSAGRQDNGGWLALFRIPNFLTVPGDTVAGWLLIAGGTFYGSAAIGGVIAASLCLYGSGLLLNDWADVDEDRRVRPDRPIPSGRVSGSAVLKTGAALMGAGVLLALTAGVLPFLCAIALGAAILVYNLAAKHGRSAAAINMGLCRGLNVLLGAAAAVSLTEPSSAPLPLLVWGFALVTLYISSVTWLAHRETEGGYEPWEGWLPVAIPALGLVAFLAISIPDGTAQWLAFIISWSLFFTVTVRTAMRFSSAAHSPSDRGPTDPKTAIPPLIGKWIGALIPLQSTLIFASGSSLEALVAGAAIIAFWPLQRRLSRWFYSS